MIGYDAFGSSAFSSAVETLSAISSSWSVPVSLIFSVVTNWDACLFSLLEHAIKLNEQTIVKIKI